MLFGSLSLLLPSGSLYTVIRRWPSRNGLETQKRQKRARDVEIGEDGEDEGHSTVLSRSSVDSHDLETVALIYCCKNHPSIDISLHQLLRINTCVIINATA